MSRLLEMRPSLRRRARRVRLHAEYKVVRLSGKFFGIRLNLTPYPKGDRHGIRPSRSWQEPHHGGRCDSLDGGEAHHGFQVHEEGRARALSADGDVVPSLQSVERGT